MDVGRILTKKLQGFECLRAILNLVEHHEGVVGGDVGLANGRERHQHISGAAAFLKHLDGLGVAVETEEGQLLIFVFTKLLKNIGLSYLSRTVEDQRLTPFAILPS